MDCGIKVSGSRIMCMAVHRKYYLKLETLALRMLTTNKVLRQYSKLPEMTSQT